MEKKMDWILALVAAFNASSPWRNANSGCNWQVKQSATMRFPSVAIDISDFFRA
jgi:hypothetical protein